MESVTAFLVALAPVFQLLDRPRIAGTFFALSLVVALILRIHATDSLNLNF